MVAVLAQDVSFPALLAAFRQRAGITRAELAWRAGVDPATITLWQQGKRTPSRAVLLVVADAIALVDDDRARLFIAAGYYPDHWPTTLEELAALTAQWQERR